MHILRRQRHQCCATQKLLQPALLPTHPLAGDARVKWHFMQQHAMAYAVAKRSPAIDLWRKQGIVEWTIERLYQDGIAPVYYDVTAWKRW